MHSDFGPKIWESKVNPYFKRNKYIFFILAAFLFFVPILFFPFNIIGDMLWAPSFYLFVYLLFLPFVLIFLNLALVFSRKYLTIYEKGLKIRINPLNPFSKKKRVLFNQIKKIEVGSIEPITFKNKISKYLLYEPNSIPVLKKAGDYTIFSVSSESGKIYSAQNSFISEIEKAESIISRQLSISIKPELKPIIKEPSKLEKEEVIKKVELEEKVIITPKEEEAEEKGDYCKFCGEMLTGSKIFCIKCGKKTIDDFKVIFCKYCGRKVSGSGEFCVKCGKVIS